MNNDSILILGGYLNLTLSTTESWGSGVLVDPLGEYYRIIFDEAKCIDLMLGVLTPMLKNGRISDARVENRQDRCLVFMELYDCFGRFHKWYFFSKVSGH